MMRDEDVKDRRPIATRDAKWAQAMARWLKEKGATPNGISVASMAFGGLAAGCLFFSYWRGGCWTSLLLVAGALFIQARLICNLLDGMVAVEGGLKTATGGLFNDLPDRVSDSFILIGLGYGLTGFAEAPVLGWCAALLAALTAYIRILGGACGLEQRFTGPMAKPHRMALVTVSAVVAAFLPAAWGQWVLFAVLVVINAGCVATCAIRTRNVYRELAARD